MTEPSQDSVKGNLLYFSPSEQEPSYFTDSLLYICDHGDLGALGLIVNRPLNLKLKDLFNSMDITKNSKAEGNVYMGGPVNPGAIFILHSSEKKWDSTMEVSKDISLSTSEDAIKSIANSEGPKDYLMTLGYSGWGSGQLEGEMERDHWILSDIDFKISIWNPSCHILSRFTNESFRNELKSCTDLFLRALLAGYFSS